MTSIAIITARGGSKRIPNKNRKLFLGIPIIEYSIMAALESGIFDEVMVSTDDEVIAEIAKKVGAKVPFYRSANSSNDMATTADVIVEVIGEYEKRGRTFDSICCIYPTAPFLTATAIKEAMETLIVQKADSVMPVVRFSFPPQRCVVINEGKIQAKWPDYMNCRSQDLEPLYHDCGQFYCLNTINFMEQKKIIMDHTYPFVQDEMNVQDIDTEEDWKIAELKYQVLHEDGK